MVACPIPEPPDPAEPAAVDEVTDEAVDVIIVWVTVTAV